MQTDYRNRRDARVSPSSSPQWPIKRMIPELWLIGAALMFTGLDLIGIDDPDATFLIVLMAALLSADIVAGAICLLKGYTAIGMLALIAWLVLPIGVAISTLVFEERWAAEFFGSLVGTAIVLVVAAPALATARNRPRYESFWARRNWTG
jgi:hypothetical protein